MFLPYVCVCVTLCVSIYLSVYLSIYLSVYLDLSIYLSLESTILDMGGVLWLVGSERKDVFVCGKVDVCTCYSNRRKRGLSIDLLVC